MDIVRLAGLGLAAAVVCGAAWGQEPRATYDEALAAVTHGLCERTETERYIRFFCEEGEALWYFTHAGRPEHPGYYVAPAYPPVDNTRLRPAEEVVRSWFEGSYGRGHSPDFEAYGAWTGDVLTALTRDRARGRPPKRDRGKLYPLEPS